MKRAAGTQSVVIIGNSAAGLAAVRAFRSVDRRTPITLIAAETHLPYSRVMLPYVLAGQARAEDVFLCDEDWYQTMGVQALTGRKAVSIDAKRGWVVTESTAGRNRNRKVFFDRLLIATGAEAERPQVPGTNLPGVFCLRTLDDAIAISAYVDRCRSLTRLPAAVFLGGGPVCLQTLAALAGRGVKTALLVRSDTILSQIADPSSASLAEKVLRAHGIRTLKHMEVRAIETRSAAHRRDRASLVVHTNHCRPLQADLVIIGKGAAPSTAIARTAGIDTDRGILVDDTMATSVPGVFAAGDVAQARHCVTGRKVCYGTWTNACEQGWIAGLNLAGRGIAWPGGLNRNVTGFFGNTLASVGVINASEFPSDVQPPITVERFRDRRGRVSRLVLFSGGRCIGAVLWNACEDVGILSWLIRSRRDCSEWHQRVTRGEEIWVGYRRARPIR